MVRRCIVALRMAKQCTVKILWTLAWRFGTSFCAATKWGWGGGGGFYPYSPLPLLFSPLPSSLLTPLYSFVRISEGDSFELLPSCKEATPHPLCISPSLPPFPSPFPHLLRFLFCCCCRFLGCRSFNGIYPVSISAATTAVVEALEAPLQFFVFCSGLPSCKP